MQNASNITRKGGFMTPNDLIQKYYDSLNRKDTIWQELWADDALFSDASQALNAKGKAAIIQSFTPFLMGVTHVTIKQLIMDENAACVIVHYEYKNPKGEIMGQDVAEVWKIKNDKLSKLTLYFDLTAYRNFIKG